MLQEINLYSVPKNGKSVYRNTQEIKQILGMYMHKGLAQMHTYEPIGRWRQVTSLFVMWCHEVNSWKWPQPVKQEKNLVFADNFTSVLLVKHLAQSEWTGWITDNWWMRKNWRQKEKSLWISKQTRKTKPSWDGIITKLWTCSLLLLAANHWAMWGIGIGHPKPT